MDQPLKDEAGRDMIYMRRWTGAAWEYQYMPQEALIDSTEWQAEPFYECAPNEIGQREG